MPDTIPSDTTATALPEWAQHCETAILRALEAQEAESYTEAEQRASEAQWSAWARAVGAYLVEERRRERAAAEAAA